MKKGEEKVEHTNIVDVYCSHIPYEEGCSFTLEVDCSAESITYFAIEDKTLDWLLVNCHSYNPNSPIYTNSWTFLQDTQYIY